MMDLLDEFVELLLIMDLLLFSQLLNNLILINVFTILVNAQYFHLHPEFFNVLLKVVDGFLILTRVRFYTIILVIVAQVASVEDIVFQWTEMIGERFKMMRSNKPSPSIFIWQSFLYILQVVVGRKIELIRSGDVIIDKLISISNHSKLLVRFITISFTINKEIFEFFLMLFLSILLGQ